MQSLKIFCCYAHEDKRWFRKLSTHLSALKHEYRLALWSDHELCPGAEWAKEIDLQLNKANIILLLISSDFIASDYCYSIEMRRALERHQREEARVIPILLRYTDWKNTPFSKLQPLPADTIPIASKHDKDEALQDVAVGIRSVVEDLLKGKQEQKFSSEKIANIAYNSEPDVRQKVGQGLEATSSQIDHYLYISDTKLQNLDLLEQQIGWAEQDIMPAQKRYQALNSALTALREKRQIWDMQSDRFFRTNDYVAGRYLIRWGVVNWGAKACFFFSVQPSLILLMAGSVYHLLENRQQKELSFSGGQLGVSSSSLPGIMSAIEFAAENSNLKWSEGIGGISDYLFALGFVQGKIIHQLKVKKLSTAFPEQDLEFVALVLARIRPPSSQQLQAFFANNAVAKDDKQEIKRMLSNAPDILIATPLYVKLGREQ